MLIYAIEMSEPNVSRKCELNNVSFVNAIFDHVRTKIFRSISFFVIVSKDNAEDN